MFRRRVLAWVLACAGIGASARAQDVARPALEGRVEPPLTMEQAVHSALDSNLGLLAERYNVKAADAAILTASLRPNPVITVSAARPDQPLVDAGLSTYEQVFRTDYIIEGGGKRGRRVDQATLAKSMAEQQLRNTTRLLILDVESAFIDVQLAKLNLVLARDSLQAFDDVVRVNGDRVRTGDLAQVELARSSLAALQFQNDVRQQEAKLHVARNRLSSLIGRGPDGDALDVTGDLRNDRQPVALDAVRREALDRRPDLRAVRGDQARNAADLRLQLANGRIDYTVSGEYHREEGTEIHGNSYLVALSVPLPIFNRNQGEVARAQVQQEQIGTRVRALENDISSEVANAYTTYASTREVVDTIEQRMLTQARDVRATTEYSYRRGEATFVEFLDAERAYNDTMQNYNSARAEYARSLYAIDSIAGRENP
jgi:outer membrane protein, heavy metal efflux system